MAWIGRWLFAVGVIHSLFGFFFARGTLATLVHEGLFNTVNGQPDREAAFWFLCTGVLLLVVGLLVDVLERRGLPVPVFATLAFLVLTFVGVVVMPLSGIWLLVPPVGGMIFRSRRTGRADAA
jgi:TRAP-type C4-dicarboxylate transport system permease large subunit